MITSLNLDTALLQEAIELERNISLETIVEIALREYIQRRKQSQHIEHSFFLTAPSIPKSPAFIQFGMFAGTQQSTEADFEIAQFQGDAGDELDWS